MNKIASIFNRIFNRRGITDVKIMSVLGRDAYIRNGVGYGFISDEYLYDNAFIEVGFGRSVSGRGDWGGGCDYASTTPLKIVVDKAMIIQKVSTDSFYNSMESKKAERIARKLANKLNVGNVLQVVDPVLLPHIEAILKFIPCKSRIGHDVFRSPHMLDHFISPNKKNEYNQLPDPKRWNV